jgi:hypothetical protein
MLDRIPAFAYTSPKMGIRFRDLMVRGLRLEVRG